MFSKSNFSNFFLNITIAYKKSLTDWTNRIFGLRFSYCEPSPYLRGVEILKIIEWVRRGGDEDFLMEMVQSILEVICRRGGGVLALNKSFSCNNFFPFNSFWYLRLLLFQIRSQPVGICKMLVINSTCKCLLIPLQMIEWL